MKNILTSLLIACLFAIPIYILIFPSNNNQYEEIRDDLINSIECNIREIQQYYEFF